MLQQEIIVERAAQISGYMSINELNWLVAKAASLEPGARWVEVGVLSGRSFLAVALSLPRESTLIAIDVNLGMQVRAGQRFFDTYQEVAYERTDLNFIMFKMTSIEAAGNIPDQSCDVVFIDADHTEDAVREDISVWEDKVAAGGLMCGHDYQQEIYPGLTKVVDELNNSRIAADSIWEWPR